VSPQYPFLLQNGALWGHVPQLFVLWKPQLPLGQVLVLQSTAMVEIKRMIGNIIERIFKLRKFVLCIFGINSRNCPIKNYKYVTYKSSGHVTIVLLHHVH
jgi:hypothetical protein